MTERADQQCEPSLYCDDVDSFVYFARVSGSGTEPDFIKIGYTTDWPQRLRALRAGTPNPIKQFVVIRAPQSREGELHDQFAHLRSTGEWFAAAPELEAFLKSIPIEERAR